MLKYLIMPILALSMLNCGSQAQWQANTVLVAGAATEAAFQISMALADNPDEMLMAWTLIQAGIHDGTGGTITVDNLAGWLENWNVAPEIRPYLVSLRIICNTFLAMIPKEQLYQDAPIEAQRVIDVIESAIDAIHAALDRNLPGSHLPDPSAPVDLTLSLE